MSLAETATFETTGSILTDEQTTSTTPKAKKGKQVGAKQVTPVRFLELSLGANITKVFPVSSLYVRIEGDSADAYNVHTDQWLGNLTAEQVAIFKASI